MKARPQADSGRRTSPERFLVATASAGTAPVHAGRSRAPRAAIAALALSLLVASGAASASQPPQPSPDERAQHARERIEQAIRLEHAEGARRNYALAHDLYCAAARDDSADALLRLGWMYANGRGVPRDDSTANTLFRRAAELGSDLGERLAASIRGETEKLPECMTPPPVAAPAPAPEDTGPTPVVESPAQFRPPPASVDARKLVELVVKMARDFRLDPRLVFALIRVESGFDPLARSAKNAQGLMQLIPETAERFAVRDVWDPVENLRGGMSYLRWLLSYFKGDVVLTLAAYNAGEGAVIRHKGVPPYGETVAYVQRIRAMYPLDRHAFDPRIAASNPPTGAKVARVGAP